MMPWIWTLFFLSIITGVIGYTSIAGPTSDIAEVLFYLLLAVFIALLLFGRRSPRS